MNERCVGINVQSVNECVENKNQVLYQMARLGDWAIVLTDKITLLYERLEPVTVSQPPKGGDAKTTALALCSLAEKMATAADVLSNQADRIDNLLESIRL